MKLRWWLLLLLGLAVAQTSLSPLLGVWRVTPDFLLVTVILMAVYGDLEGIFLFAPLLGYVKDIFGGGVTGVSFLVFFLSVFFVRFERYRLNFDSYFLDVTVAVATLVEGIVSFTLAGTVNSWENGWWSLSYHYAGRALYNVLLAEGMRLAWQRVLLPFLSRQPARRRFREAV